MGSACVAIVEKGGIVKIDAVKQYVDDLTRLMNTIHQSAATLREACEGEELTEQLGRLARVAASLSDDVLNPLFREYPEAKPEDYVL